MTKVRHAKGLIGREYELDLLAEEYSKTSEKGSLIALYGRRRVGKTRLIEEFYKDKNIWKFDGIENSGRAKQIKNILSEIATYTDDEIYRSVSCSSWLDLLKLLDKAIRDSKGGYNKTIFLDEFPYMAGRKEELVSSLKWAWDNLWQDKKGFSLILCGSVASFMVRKVIRSSALYGRIKLEICLKPLSISEVSDFFGGKKSAREICNLYMFCGGVPEYLLHINSKESVAQNISRLAFCKDGYFVDEFDRIFKDIFQEERIYKQIINLLSKYKNLKIPELTGILNISGGGGFVEYMENLESAGFIRSVTPWNKPKESKLRRYRLDDEYLLFYFKFIHPNLKVIRDNSDLNFGLSYLKGSSYNSWLGFAFERLCLKHAPLIMKSLKIDQLVKSYGAYFDRSSNVKEGVQIDLMFLRHDPVTTICEMKYSNGLIGKEIIEEMEKKVSLLNETKKTVEKVLVTTNGGTKELIESGYFSKIITIDELFLK